MQKPTIGQIVHYYKEHPSDEGCEGPYAAMVTKTYMKNFDDVDLMIFTTTHGAVDIKFRTKVSRSKLPFEKCWVFPRVEAPLSHPLPLTKGHTLKEKRGSFENAAKPLVKWINENSHPHAQVIVNSVMAELVEGQMLVKIEEFIRD